MQINQRIDQLYKLGKEYAKAKAQTEYLKHFRKAKLSMLKIAMMAENPKMTNATATDHARTDTEYLEVLNGIKIATEISEAALWELKTAHAGISIYQTRQADRRAELKNLHHQEG